MLGRDISRNPGINRIISGIDKSALRISFLSFSPASAYVALRRFRACGWRYPSETLLFALVFGDKKERGKKEKEGFLIAMSLSRQLADVTSAAAAGQPLESASRATRPSQLRQAVVDSWRRLRATRSS